MCVQAYEVRADMFLRDASGMASEPKGLHWGKLSIIGSMAGEGRDVLSLGIARHAAAADMPSCFFCPDKSTIEIGRRIMSAEAGVPMETLFSGNDLDGEESVLCDAGTTQKAGIRQSDA